MVNNPKYVAATEIATKVEAHFIQHIADAIALGEKVLTPAPKLPVIEKLIDVAFWSSLRREEGYSPKISLALLPPEHAEAPLLFAQKFQLTPAMLTKISPGVERAGIHLGVWFDDDNELFVWGTTGGIRSICLVLDVSEPGLLVVKHRRISGFGKFVNIAVLSGDQMKFIDEHNINTSECPAVLTSLLGLSSPSSWNDSVNVLVQIAVSMRAHKHGGTLLVVPQKSKKWKHSFIHPMPYAVKPTFTGLSSLIDQNQPKEKENGWQNSLRREVDKLAGLTAVDGATLINDRYELLAFGAKITRTKTGKSIENIMATEPINGNKPQFIHPTYYGGTRHLSAAQFVYDQKDAMAMVASQDGKFTIFNWSACENVVHANRVDALLL